MKIRELLTRENDNHYRNATLSFSNKRVEGGRAMRAFAFLFFYIFEQMQFEYFFAKVAFIKFLIKNGFIGVFELS